MTHEEERFLAAIALQTRDRVGTARRRPDDFRRNTFGIQQAFYVLRRLDLVAGRIAGVYFYESRKKIHRLLMGVLGSRPLCES